jgi:hypothetical protein
MCWTVQYIHIKNTRCFHGRVERKETHVVDLLGQFILKSNIIGLEITTTGSKYSHRASGLRMYGKPLFKYPYDTYYRCRYLFIILTVYQLNLPRELQGLFSGFNLPEKQVNSHSRKYERQGTENKRRRNRGRETEQKATGTVE